MDSPLFFSLVMELKSWRQKSGISKPGTTGQLNRIFLVMLTALLFILLTVTFVILPILVITHRSIPPLTGGNG